MNAYNKIPCGKERVLPITVKMFMIETENGSVILKN